MAQTTDRLFQLKAADLMSEDLVVFPQAMPLRQAAQRLHETGVHGGPVVDQDGRCVGVLSVMDFLRRKMWPLVGGQAKSCSFQRQVQLPDGREAVACTLPFGMCPAQREPSDTSDDRSPICALPHCVFEDWQVVESDEVPDEPVAKFMSSNPVAAGADCPIWRLARIMLDAGIHRVIIVDADRRPIGIVSNTDLLSALATPDDAGGE